MVETSQQKTTNQCVIVLSSVVATTTRNNSEVFTQLSSNHDGQNSPAAKTQASENCVKGKAFFSSSLSSSLRIWYDCAVISKAGLDRVMWVCNVCEDNVYVIDQITVFYAQMHIKSFWWRNQPCALDGTGWMAGRIIHEFVTVARVMKLGLTG